MNILDFIDKQIDRLPGWPDGRGLVGLAVFMLTVLMFVLIAAFPDLREDEFFKTVATAIIITGFVNSVVAYAFSQSQGPRSASGKPDDPVNVKEREG